MPGTVTDVCSVDVMSGVFLSGKASVGRDFFWHIRSIMEVPVNYFTIPIFGNIKGPVSISGLVPEEPRREHQPITGPVKTIIAPKSEKGRKAGGPGATAARAGVPPTSATYPGKKNIHPKTEKGKGIEKNQVTTR